MSMRRCLVILLALAVAMSAAPVGAVPGTLIIGKSQSASAMFTSVSSDGCVQTDVTVYAVDGDENSPPGPPEVQGFAAVNINTVALCEPGPGLSAAGGILNPDFQVDQQLTTATLNASIPVSGDLPISSVEIHLTWTGTGEIVRSHSHDHVRTPDFVAIFNGTGDLRTAQASGSVSDGVTNFTPLPAISANLTSGHFVELTFAP